LPGSSVSGEGSGFSPLHPVKIRIASMAIPRSEKKERFRFGFLLFNFPISKSSWSCFIF
jgi:hypothetical protein